MAVAEESEEQPGRRAVRRDGSLPAEPRPPGLDRDWLSDRVSQGAGQGTSAGLCVCSERIGGWGERKVCQGVKK